MYRYGYFKNKYKIIKKIKIHKHKQKFGLKDKYQWDIKIF